MAVILRYRKLNNNRYNIYLDIYKDGIRKTRTLTGYIVTKDYSKQTRKTYANKQDEELVIKAEAQAADLNTELISGRPLVHRDIELFHYIEKIMSKSARVQYTSYQRLRSNLKKYHPAKILVSKISTLWIRDFKSYLVKRHKSTTVDIYLNLLMRLLEAAVEENYIYKNPFPKKNFYLRVDLNKKTSKDFLTLKEVTKLNQTQFDSNICKAFLFSCFTGLRLGDIELLEWDNIIDDTIQIVQQKTRNKVPKENTIPLSNQANAILRSLNKRSNSVFELPNRANISNTIKMWGNLVGIKKNMHFHMARHTFGALFLESGGSIYTLKELLGHSTVVTTEKYYGHLVDTMKRSQIELMPTI